MDMSTARTLPEMEKMTTKRLLEYKKRWTMLAARKNANYHEGYPFDERDIQAKDFYNKHVAEIKSVLNKREHVERK